MRNKIYQFKISLNDINPSIWRRILVPATYSFWDLHVAIQDSMGWLDYHLHVFRIRQKHSYSDSEIGIPNEDSFDDEHEAAHAYTAAALNHHGEFATLNDVGGSQ